MSQEKQHWTKWLSNLNPRSGTNAKKKSVESPAPLPVEVNPWLELSAARGPIISNATMAQVRHGEVDGGSSATTIAPLWASDTRSPYGFTDDDGTLRQVENSSWRNAFGAKSSRFVPATGSTSRWQVGPRNSTLPPERFASSTWTLRIAAAVVLVAGGYLATHSNSPLADKIKPVYESAFSTDYSGVLEQQAESVFHISHLSLPALLNHSSALVLHQPLSGSIVGDYSASQPVMVIQGTKNEPVVAVGSGKVVVVQKLAAGYSVEIDHGKLGQSWYSGLARVAVKKDEAVTSGQVIGRLPKDHPQLGFALKQDGKYVNPHDSIRFEKTGV